MASYAELFESNLSWVGDRISAYFISMGEILSNTLEDSNMSMSGFNEYKDISLLWLDKAWTSRLVIVCAVSTLLIPILTCKLLCWCLCGHRKQAPMLTGESGHTRLKVQPESRSLREPTHEAIRWFKQAEFDFQAAKNDLHAPQPAFEWVCYKCQQSAEKSIKGALIIQYNRADWSDDLDSDVTWSHNLIELARGLNDKSLSRITLDIQKTIGHPGRMRYPDCLPYPKVPRDWYSRENAKGVLKTTDRLLKHIREHYFDL